MYIVNGIAYAGEREQEPSVREVKPLDELNLKAGMIDPLSQRRLTYPSGIEIPASLKIVLLRNSVTAESLPIIETEPF